jgi:hypothetical protein
MLQKGKVNFLLDQFYGSSAKGQVVTAIADKYRPEILIANHSTSASHTVIEGKEEFIFKALPTASFLNRVRKDYKPLVVLSSDTGFELNQLLKEIEYCGLAKEQVIIHPRAAVITQDHKDKEAGENGTLHLGSTMSGQSYAFSEKMTRQKGVRLAKDYPELREVATIIEDTDYYPFYLSRILDAGGTALMELPQGFPLSLNHGPQFPYSTFRDITPDNAISFLGLNATDYRGSVIANVRALPIRVSNRYEGNTMDNVTLLLNDGTEVKPSDIEMDYSDVNAITYDVNYKGTPRSFGRHIITRVNGVVGTSGPFEDDMQEISWRELSNELTFKAGKETRVKEITTLTKLNRRIAKSKNGSISKSMLQKSKVSVGPTHFSITFLNYVDPTIEGATTMEQILVDSKEVAQWLLQAQKDIIQVFGKNVPIIALQAGKELSNVVLIEEGLHKF